MTKRAKIWWLVGILVVAVAGGGGAVIASRQLHSAAGQRRQERRAAAAGVRPGGRRAAAAEAAGRRADGAGQRAGRVAGHRALPSCRPRSSASWCAKATVSRRPDGRRVRYRATASAARRAHRDARVGPRPAGYDRAHAPGQRPAGQAELHFAERVRHGGFGLSGAAGRGRGGARAARADPDPDERFGRARPDCRPSSPSATCSRARRSRFDAPLLAIVDLSQLEVQAQVPVSDVPQIRKGMPAQVDIEGISGRSLRRAGRPHQPEHRDRHAHGQHLRARCRTKSRC